VKLAERLLLGSFVVVSVLVIVVVVLSGQRLGGDLRRNTADQLQREAQLVAASWRPGVDSDSLANVSGRALGHRVTLIDSTGRVIGDSEFDGPALAQLENHSTRPEVVAARDSGAGSADRISKSAGDEELYVAVRAARGIARVSQRTAQLDAIVARARRDVLASGLAALVVALLVASAFSRTVSRPVAELRDVAKSLASGDLSRRPALSAPGEVGDLAAAVHRMAEQLDSRLRALEADDNLMSALFDSLHQGVVAVDARRQVLRVNDSGRQFLHLRDAVPFSIDLLPRDRMLREALHDALAGQVTEEVELCIAGRTLALTARPLPEGGAVLAMLDLTSTKKLETVRRDFVANVSHELKTPLTVIGGFAETLTTDDIPGGQRLQFAEAIRVNARRMQRIVDDLLDLSRIESGGWVPNPSLVDVRAIAGEVIAANRPAAQERGVSLDLDIDANARSVYADPTALRQIFSNLVENAIRYTNAPGKVTIFAGPGDGATRVGVRDTGVGIAPDHLPRIFERFYRVDTARSRDAGGTGLGLSIVRHLAEAHRAAVNATSELGKGTVI